MRKILLALSCLSLLAPMFLIAVTSSAPYDAWSDLDDDGDIDIFDVVTMAGAYGTTGDPTKRVSVANWLPPEPKRVFYMGFYVQWQENNWTTVDWHNALYVANYTRMSILVEVVEANTFPGSGDALWKIDYRWLADWAMPLTGINDNCFPTIVQIGENKVGQHAVNSYEIKAPYVQLRMDLMNHMESHQGSALLYVYIYLSYGTQDTTLKTMTYDTFSTTGGDHVEFGPFLTNHYRQYTLGILTPNGCKIIVLSGAFGKYYFDVPPSTYTEYTCEVLHDSIHVFAYEPGSLPFEVYFDLFLTE